MGICLTQELVERYTTGVCSDDERQVIEAHLAECKSCRQQTQLHGSNIRPSGKPESPNPDEAATIASVAAGTPSGEKTCVLPDEYPTKSISEAVPLPPDKQDFATLLESMIEGYEIVEEMPRGGQAVVYKGLHTATKTHVAIKVLLPTLLASAQCDTISSGRPSLSRVSTIPISWVFVTVESSIISITL